MQIKRLSIIDQSQVLKILGIALFGAVFFGMFYAFPPRGVAWSTFSSLPAHWTTPYDVDTFINPPYIMAFILYMLLPFRWSNAINAIINLGVLALVNWKYKGGLFGLLLIFTSAYFLNLMVVNNIDWIPLLGVMCPPWLGAILISVKPQTVAGVGLIWLKRHGPKVLIPVTVVAALSLVIWRGWIFQWIASEHKLGLESAGWNFALFPYLVPLGIFMLYKAWKTDDEILAAMATACFMPYFAMYSVTSVLAIAGRKHRIYAITLWVIGWILIVRNILSAR